MVCHTLTQERGMLGQLSKGPKNHKNNVCHTPSISTPGPSQEHGVQHASEGRATRPRTNLLVPVNQVNQVPHAEMDTRRGQNFGAHHTPINKSVSSSHAFDPPQQGHAIH
ncbi:hypothetical protein S245_043908 [Arachis hypogaea]